MKKRNWLSVLLFFPLFATGQIITTVAGGGTSHANGIPATSANLGTPEVLVKDKEGNIIYTDEYGHRILKILTDGIITTICGTGTKGFSGDGGPATNALLYQPSGVTIDETDNIYFIDKGNNRVRKIDAATGIITTIAGNGTAGYGGDGSPATASFVALNTPFGILYNNGEIYIADAINHRIRKIDKSGIITTFAGSGGLGHTGDGGPATNATFEPEYGLAIDASGNLFFNDAYQMIRKIDTKGIITTVAGNPNAYEYNGDERPATSANIVLTTLAFNHAGELFFAGYTSHRVRKIDNNGYIHTVAGNGTTGFSGDGGDALSASVDRPTGVVFDSCDNLLIGEVEYGRIRKVAFNPLCWRLGVEEGPEVADMQVYPTPAVDELHVDGAPAGSYSIVNTAGQVVQQGKLNVHNVIDVRNVAAGVYMLVTTNEQTGERVVRKILKQ